MIRRACYNLRCASALLLLVAASATAQPLTTAFTYQGELRASGAPASGLHDLRFRLYDAASGGAQVGPTLCSDNLGLTNGRFTVDLDFGSQFSGQQRFLEIDVRADTGLTCGNGVGFITLAPRQPLTGAPNALFALTAASASTASSAATATNASQLNGQSGSFYQNAGNLTGTLPSGLLSGSYTGALTFGNAANAFTGSGAGLIGLNASNIASGTLADARLTANVAMLNTNQTFTGGKAFSAAPAFTAPGVPFTVTSSALVTNLNADQLDGMDSTAFLQSIPVPLTLSGTNPASHIIRGENAATDNNSYGVRGDATGASGITYGVYARSLSTSGRGVYGYASATSGTTYGGRFESASTSGRAVYGTATATSGYTYGGYFLSDSTSGTGVYGYASAGSGFAVGGHFRSDSASGYGVFGETTATSGATYGGRFENASTSGRAVYGVAVATSGPTHGGSFLSDSTGGIGVWGHARAGSGSTVGGRFRSDSAAGYGVFADTPATSGTTYGGRFESASTGGRGVYGYASASSGTTYGVYGESMSSSGYAGYFVGSGSDALYVQNASTGRGAQVVATNDTALWALTTSGVAGVDGRNASATGRGVYGYATASTGTNYGVYGRTASSSGYGVYSLGNTGASGTKSFRIDHPLDPEHKYLLHYSTESPEVLNAYSGNVTLDGAGEAVVELPPYFASINKDPRYTLTAVGAPMPMLHVAERISAEALADGERAGPGNVAPACSFRIGGGAPGGEVCWRVEAVRNDLRMRLHGAPVEQEKAGPERGMYQHPEFYAQPLERGMDHRADGVPTRSLERR